MAKLDFAFETRFFPPMQPEDVPAFVITHGYNSPLHAQRMDLSGVPFGTLADSPASATSVAAGEQQATEQVPESADTYKLWLDECRAMDEEVRLAGLTYKEAKELAEEEIKRLNRVVSQAREHWYTVRRIPKPAQPPSSRRKK